MTASASDLDRRAWIQSALGVPILAAALFIPAGTFHYWQGWLFGAVFIAASSALGLYFLKHDPALLKRRMAVGPTAEREPTQKIIVTMLTISFLLMMVVPGLDHRWGWSSVPVWLVLLANAGVILSFAIFFVVMKQNSYAAATIRVEAGQPLVSTGIYGIVRHPMYSGALILMICMPLALGSYWTLLVLILALPVLVWRILNEENVLTRDLAGYTEYCRKVRYRLIPGIW
jgi:protein-S-isoprenylcysteine O-methyltransferase Ste14